MNERVRKVDAGGLGVRVVDHGDGPAVLLCHGFPETAHACWHQIAMLAEAGYRTIASDMHGYGGTDALESIGSYTVFDSVGDLVRLLDALEVPEATIVGDNWGATVAWQAALMRPDCFTAIVGVGVPLVARARETDDAVSEDRGRDDLHAVLPATRHRRGQVRTGCRDITAPSTIAAFIPVTGRGRTCAHRDF